MKHCYSVSGSHPWVHPGTRPREWGPPREDTCWAIVTQITLKVKRSLTRENMVVKESLQLVPGSESALSLPPGVDTSTRWPVGPAAAPGHLMVGCHCVWSWPKLAAPGRPPFRALLSCPPPGGVTPHPSSSRLGAGIPGAQLWERTDPSC